MLFILLFFLPVGLFCCLCFLCMCLCGRLCVCVCVCVGGGGFVLEMHVPVIVIITSWFCYGFLGSGLGFVLFPCL